jgi:hypothetical protein
VAMLGLVIADKYTRMRVFVMTLKFTHAPYPVRVHYRKLLIEL